MKVAIEEEQRRFEAAIPFDRFSAGVERASRTPRQVAAPPRAWVQYALAVAAGLVLITAIPVLLNGGKGGSGHHNGLKGGVGVNIVVAGPANGPQRTADPRAPEALTPGERIRIGYHAGNYRYLAAVSVDEHGEISVISDGAVPNGEGYLPDALELTGQGLERVIIVMSNEPLPDDELRRAIRTRFDEARGNLSQLGMLDVPGEQFHQVFLKP